MVEKSRKEKQQWFEIMKPTFISFFSNFIENTKYFATLYCRVNHFDSLSCFSCSFNINQNVILYHILYVQSLRTLHSGYSHYMCQSAYLSMPAPYAPNYSFVFKWTHLKRMSRFQEMSSCIQTPDVVSLKRHILFKNMPFKKIIIQKRCLNCQRQKRHRCHKSSVTS